jgi:hypothetical protein
MTTSAKTKSVIIKRLRIVDLGIPAGDPIPVTVRWTNRTNIGRRDTSFNYIKNESLVLFV